MNLFYFVLYSILMICKHVLYINNYSESSSTEEEEPPIAAFAISFKYGVACQHVYPLEPANRIKTNGPGKPINAKIKEKKTDVTIINA